MHPDKKLTKEDTWKSEYLRRHLKGGGHDEESVRRRDENERRYRTGESVERRNRDPERDAQKERETPRAERDSARERTKPRDSESEIHSDRRKDDSRDRAALRVEREKDRRREQDRVKGTDSGKYQDEDGDRRHKRHDREGRENRERVKEREERTREREQEPPKERDQKVKDTNERDREKERRGLGERDRRKDRERGPGERDKERRSDRERKRSEDRGDGVRGHDPERRDRHVERDESERYTEAEKRRDKERKKERPVNKDPSEQQGDREYREQRGKGKEDRRRSHKDNSESQRYKEESREAERDRIHKERRRTDGEREKEMDKHGERRTREGDDLDRDPRERRRKLSPSDLRTPKEKADPAKTKEVVVQSKSARRVSQGPLSDKVKPVKKGEAPAVDQGSDAAEDYEEDFEDYEEDFEDADESDGDDKQTMISNGKREEQEDVVSQRRKDVLAIQRAMEEENQRVGSAHHKLHTDVDTPTPSRDSETAPSQDSHQHGRFMNFVAAKHREVSKVVASKQKKRSTDLLRLIDLDFSMTFSILDLPPVNEYDMYIKSFGTTNTKQAYVQCNEDNTDRDVQTEEINVSEMWTQHPAERNVVCGGRNLSRETSDESGTNLRIDSQRLARFLRSASQVVAVLLEEQRADRGSKERLRTQAEALSFSDGCLQLNTKLPFLYDRQVSLVHFSQVQRQTMLSVHSPLTKPSAVRLDSKTIICIWNIWEPSCPQKVLVYESEVNCCCFSPGKATLVFAGTSVGSVVLWDLREHASTHHALRIGEKDWTLRHPTFSTDAVLALSGHVSSVCSVEAVPATIDKGLRPELPLFTSDEDSSGLSFQLASLDENGVLNLWVVLELPKANDAGSQTDLGLRPGGRVKLLHSSTVATTSERFLSGDAEKTPPFQALILKCLPADSNHFFICTNLGLVTHRTSHGLKASPKFYRPQVDGFRPVDVTSIDFSPFGEPVFLVGCGDGSVRLHTVLSERPLMEWSSSTAGQPVVSVRWALTRPAVFCVLDAASRLHIWNLLEKDFEPVITESVDADRITAMSVFGDPAKQNTYSGIAMAMQSGKIEMQYFCRKFTEAESADLEKLKSLVHEAF